MNLTEFQQWLFAAEPGQSLIYYVGNLATSREHQPELAALADEVMRASDAGFVVLTQRRISEQFYAYQAKRTEEIVG